MIWNLILSGIFVSGILFLPVHLFLKNRNVSVPWIFYYLFFLLPFLAGGFHTYTVPVTVLMLGCSLISCNRRNKHLRFNWNIYSLTIALIVLGYCISPFWGADRGMAVFGIARYLPLILLAAVIMQHSAEERENALLLVPICGVCMTLVSGVLFLIPALRDTVAVNGRLAGFFQYPNAYATFLLMGIVILASGKRPGIPMLIAGISLLVGLYLSGSRTGLFLLAVAAIGILVVRGKLHPLYAGVLMGGLLLISALVILSGSADLQLVGRDLGSVFVRLLYYKDAIPIILKHPFGIGYMGYRAMEAAFQTGRYSVSFVHNSVLQLLLDIGWVPGLLFVICIVRSLLSQKLPSYRKLALLTLILHSLLEFSFQFFVFWCLLLLLWDAESDKVRYIQKNGWMVPLLIPIFLLCLWLGSSDLLYRCGNIDAVLKLTPFHTEAMAEKLTELSDDRELDALADRILALNPTHSLACSAKANAALMRGEVKNMIRWKEEAIACAPYATEEYCDYIDKLYALAVRYSQLGDKDSASYCLDKLLKVPQMMKRISSGTDPLAYLTTTNTELVLPEEYEVLISALSAQ